MALTPGTRLGVYEITAQIGEGGMGQVFRATDAKLKRQVAIKILPPTVAADVERLARFQREAELLASLNHPNIAAIYGLEESAGLTALVMELVEGDDLSQRIARGPIPIDEALPIAKQIAEALEAAHEQGIIHRDLKPANIKVRADGTVKVLDFGLAKALNPLFSSSAAVALANSPTITSPGAMTAAGIILGTAAYMSPEQARGKVVDKRTDVWAFGCVLYEMATAHAAFKGGTVSDTIAAILERDPDWTALPSATPACIRRLLPRCLEKNPKRRLHDIADARIEIDDALAPAAAEMIPTGTARLLRVAAVAVAAVAGGTVIAALTWAVLRPALAPPVPTSRFAIVLQPSETLNAYGSGRGLALSPDGRILVYRAGGTMNGGSPLMVRAFGELDARPLGDIDTAVGPFFSPDSRWIGFFGSPAGITENWLMKVPVTGGPAIALCVVKGNGLGASWAEDNTIVFATDDPATGLWQAPANGGGATPLTTPDAAHREGDHLFPSVIAGSRNVLFTIVTRDQDKTQVAVLDRKSGLRKTLVRGGSDAEYVPSGHLIYTAGGALRAVRFDAASLEVIGDTVPVIEHVMTTASGAANYAVSRTGTLVYAPGGGGPQRSFVWVDRHGREEPIKAPARDYDVPRLSPDGTRIVVAIDDPANIDLWMWDFARERLTRLTVDSGRDVMPVWTPDSRRVIFASNRSGLFDLYATPADGFGAPERLTTSAPCCGQMPTSITPDGSRIIGFGSGRGSQQDLLVIPLANPLQQQLLLQTPFTEVFAEVSPDARYIAYQGNESGRIEVYVRPFPGVNGGRWQVSRDGGTRPAWARNGRELFYLDAAKTLTAVSVQTGSVFSMGTPARVFDTQYSSVFPARQYDVASDGRFLMMKEVVKPASVVIVEHWLEDLDAHLPNRNPQP